MLPGEERSEFVLDGRTFETIVTRYANRVRVLFLENNKIQTLLSASRNETIPAFDAAARYDVECLLGDRDDQVSDLVARRLVESCTLPLVLGLSFSTRPPMDFEFVKRIVDHLVSVVECPTATR